MGKYAVSFLSYKVTEIVTTVPGFLWLEGVEDVLPAVVDKLRLVQSPQS